ncbi:glucose 1-dehydrogenase [Blastopirellula marina]|uniref:Probable glucose 1-dehydrogenase n=1 Tax=Blastopirellula marina DSM 3645 TaxID=314230 RepID=A3ZY41_9BACT|nr:glucose 1-dehydrogenase [Blastopirellula marina]EAQ78503.1 probable glucose 1-dehydrogenase [Blastopirellula marina DSM 3645]
MEIRLDGKRALVTGGSSGIGAAIAVELGAAGAKVVVNYRSHADAAAEIVRQITDVGGQATAVQADVSDQSAVVKMFEQMDDVYGGIDILINNAGIDGKRVMSWEIDPEDWRKVIDVNMLGSFYCAQQALKRMIPASSGVVISVSSVHEEIAWSGYSAYAASKSGVAMMTKTLAQEAAPYGVRVLAIAPGAIKTAINKPVWSDPEQRKDLLTKIPLNRIGEPKEIAEMTVVLASDVASYITGRTIFIDGGMTDYPSFAEGG